MQKGEQHESSIAEQEYINITHARRKEEPSYSQKVKYASINQIRAFERSSQVYNQKLLETRPLLFSEESLSSVLPMHFVSSVTEQSFTLGGRKEETKGILQLEQDKLILKLAVSNIRRENSFMVSIKNMKMRGLIELSVVQMSNQEATVKFKYSMNLHDTNLLLRVLIELDGEYKVWKEVQVPLAQNKFTIEIHEYNHQQTDIKINEFLFHLILKMPYHEKINYYLVHQNYAQVQKVQFISKPQKKQVQAKETECTNECQLI